MNRVLCFMAFAVLAIFSLTIVSCGDDNEDLGGGYTYYSEQKMINGKFQIPPTILEYKYNSEIIIAKQHPTKYKDIMYIDYNYPLGRDTIYYWIIEKKTNTITGPINYVEFLKEISKYDEYECLSKCKATKYHHLPNNNKVGSCYERRRHWIYQGLRLFSFPIATLFSQ